MPTVPLMTPQVDENVGSMSSFSAPEIKPMQNFAPEQMQKFGQALSAASEAAIKIQDQLDDAKVKQLDNQFSEELRKTLYDPKTGYLNTVGQSAVESRANADSAINAARQRIEGQLQNNLQRKIFSQVADRRMVAAMTDMDQHQVKELNAWNKTESTSRINNSIEDMVKNSTSYSASGSQYKLYKGALLQEVNQLAELSGIPIGSESYKALEREYLTKAHSAVISNLVASNKTQEASDYLSSNKGEIDSEQLDNLQNLVNSSSNTANSVRVYRALAQMPGGLKAQIRALNDAVDNGKSIAGVKNVADYYDHVKSSLEHDDTEAKQGIDKSMAAILGGAQDEAYKNPNMTVLDWMNKHPLEYRALMNNGHNDSLGAIFKSTGVTDPKVKFNMYTSIGTGNENDILKMSTTQLYAVASKLDSNDRDWMLGQVASSQKKQNDPGNIPKNFANLLNNKLTQIGMGYNSVKGDNAKTERYNTIIEYAQRYILDAQIQNGKPFDNDQLSSKLNELFAKNIPYRDMLFGFIDTGRTVEPMLQTTVPSDQAEKIRQALIMEGNPNPTDRQIQFRYWDTYGR